MRMKADPKAAAGRAFVRSLNILLKFARLYGYEHARTIEQLQIAWQELRTAIPLGTDSGLLLKRSYWSIVPNTTSFTQRICTLRP